MADKTTGELTAVNVSNLTAAADIYDDFKMPGELQGSAVHVTGAQMKQYAVASVQPLADAADADAVTAKTAAASAENAKTAAQSALAGVQEALNNLPAGDTLIINDLTTGGASAALSAEMGKVLGRRPNKNLLHNTDLTHIVDQKEGYVVPIGVTVYGDSAFKTEIGTTSLYQQVDELTSSYGTYKSGSNTRYVKVADLKRGYVNKGSGYAYCFDRWRLNESSVFEYLEGQGLKNGGAGDRIMQILEPGLKAVLDGRTCTLSVICNGTLYTHTFVYAASPGTSVVLQGDATIQFWLSAGGNIIFYLYTAGSILSAVKLELGSVQTLAHQNAEGNWVLNEVPDYGEELAKCQRYMQVINSQISVNGFLTQAKTNLRLVVPTPVALRAKPALTSCDISSVRTTATDGATVAPEVSEFSVHEFSGSCVTINAVTAAFSDAKYINNTPIACYINELVLDANL